MHSRTSARAQSLIWHAPDPTAVGVVCHATAVAGLALHGQERKGRQEWRIGWLQGPQGHVGNAMGPPALHQYGPLADAHAQSGVRQQVAQ
jgi:hypothetical protein